MRRLYVVTHPEATHHIERLVGGWYDSQLTPAGLAAADLIGAGLRATIPAGAEVELYSSDLRRTHQTAAAITKHVRTGIQLDHGLREKSYGEAEGRAQSWLDQRFIPPPTVGERMRHDEGIPGSETKWALAQRVYASMEKIIRSDCEYQIVVTHGMATTFVVASWLKLPMESLGYVAFGVAPGSITELMEDDFFHNRRVTRLGDVTHLAQPT